MILSREVRTGTGVLLLPKGESMGFITILLVNRHFRLDPPDDPAVFVWTEDKWSVHERRVNLSDPSKPLLAAAHIEKPWIAQAGTAIAFLKPK
jgi:hypothetical protein